MTSKKECPYCRKLCDHITKEFHIPVEPPELLKLIEDSQKQNTELTKTLQALRTTYTNTNAFMTKENLMISFQIAQTSEDSKGLQSEIDGLRKEIEELKAKTLNEEEYSDDENEDEK